MRKDGCSKTMKLLFKTSTEDGKLNSAELEDARGRRFYWCRRLPVQQEIHAKNPHGAGQCETWHRKAGRIDAGVVTHHLKSLGLLSSSS